MLVRVPGESRLEIVTEESVETIEAILVGADNLEESHADAIANVLKRQLLRRFTSNAPTLEELRDKVREQPRDKSSGASEPVATGAVRVGGGGNAALRTRLASPERVMATAPAGQDGQGKSGKRTRSGAAQPAAKRKKAPAVAGDVLPPSEGSAAGKLPPKPPTFVEIFTGAILEGLSAATRLYHYKLRTDSLNAGGPQYKVLEAEAVSEAKQAAIRVALAKPRDLSVEDCERLLRFAVEHLGDEDPLPPVFFKRLLEHVLHCGLWGGASQPAPGSASVATSFLENLGHFLDPTPPSPTTALDGFCMRLPEALPDVPVTFLLLHDRLEITSHLLGEVYSEVFPKELDGCPLW